MFSEAVDVAIIGGVFGLGAIVLHHEYPVLRKKTLEYFLKNMNAI